MRYPPDKHHPLAAILSLALHAGAFALFISSINPFGPARHPAAPSKPAAQLIEMKLLPVPAPEPAAPPVPEPVPLPDAAAVAPPLPLIEPPPLAERPPATQAAPPAPSAQDWAFAARYTLKNSKGYRHSWGRQVRSMMGTAVEGPEQGLVRFRVEIAADGRLRKLETLWTTSARAEQLARQAVEAMPDLPPTPTGQPLVFERTIAFTPFATDDAPIYRDDCLPDPPAFRNPFAWDGRSAPVMPAAPRPQPADRPDPQALADCLRQLPRDSLEAESARDQRLWDQGRSSKLGR